MAKIRSYASLFATSISLTVILMPMVSSANGLQEPFKGPYVGVDGGQGWASSRYQTNPNCPADPANAVFCNASPDSSSGNGTAVANSGSGTLNLNGFNYSALAGYNWNKSGIVYGGEADFGGWHTSHSNNTTGVFPAPFLGTNYSLHNSVSTNWLATMRGRIGVMSRSQFLLYATGGLAFTDLKVTSGYNDNAIDSDFPGGSGSATNSQFQTGWTAGIGGEWAFSDAYSVKIEYLYVKFGSTNVNVPISNTPAYMQTMKVGANLDAQLVRIGFNFQP